MTCMKLSCSILIFSILFSVGVNANPPILFDDQAIPDIQDLVFDYLPASDLSLFLQPGVLCRHQEKRAFKSPVVSTHLHQDPMDEKIENTVRHHVAKKKKHLNWVSLDTIVAPTANDGVTWSNFPSIRRLLVRDFKSELTPAQINKILDGIKTDFRFQTIEEIEINAAFKFDSISPILSELLYSKNLVRISLSTYDLEKRDVKERVKQILAHPQAHLFVQLSLGRWGHDDSTDLASNLAFILRNPQSQLESLAWNTRCSSNAFFDEVASSLNSRTNQKLKVLKFEFGSRFAGISKIAEADYRSALESKLMGLNTLSVDGGSIYSLSKRAQNGYTIENLDAGLIYGDGHLEVLTQILSDLDLGLETLSLTTWRVSGFQVEKFVKALRTQSHLKELSWRIESYRLKDNSDPKMPAKLIIQAEEADVSRIFTEIGKFSEVPSEFATFSFSYTRSPFRLHDSEFYRFGRNQEIQIDIQPFLSSLRSGSTIQNLNLAFSPHTKLIGIQDLMINSGSVKSLRIDFDYLSRSGSVNSSITSLKELSIDGMTRMTTKKFKRMVEGLAKSQDLEKLTFAFLVLKDLEDPMWHLREEQTKIQDWITQLSNIYPKLKVEIGF